MQKKSEEYRKDTYTHIKYLKGVGEGRARLLARLGIHHVLDLMEHFPRYYIHRQIDPTLHKVKPGDHVAFTANISWVERRKTKSGKNILSAGINDMMNTLVCSWFSIPPWLEKILVPGNKIWVNGMVSEYNGQLQMTHPEVEVVDDEAEDDFWKKRLCLPVYPSTAGLTQKVLRGLVHQAFAIYASTIQENLPQFILEKRGFRDRNTALQLMHFIQTPQQAPEEKRRFAYEELFFTQLLWARHRYYHGTKVLGNNFQNRQHFTTQLKNKLPFQLTTAQKRVIREIFRDMCSDKQMSRLMQGDVGSGKTIVTLFAMLLAVENGFQAAMMAPTEILAEQHYESIKRFLEGMPIKVALLKGGSSKEKKQTMEDISRGEYHIIVGTHALIQEGVSYHKLGFVAVDEQHRFGVQQRAALAKKDNRPDLLYLSATPIPRSLSMTVYGDLEVSVIDELPPSRKPVMTRVRSSRQIGLVWKDVRKELEKKHQVYVVCPLIEESDKVDLLDAQRLHEELEKEVFPEYVSELLHGRMPAAEKDEIMRRFKAGKISILVSTTVIEVGVDVPNASVMVVQHAERFGLAQLHQLRGRVGRGAVQSYCFLIEHQPNTRISRERLNTMASTTDGFVIAEKDLELRGPGEFFGTEQAGMPNFRFANLIKDQDLLKMAREDAFEIIREDPNLEADSNVNLKNILQAQLSKKEELIQY